MALWLKAICHDSGVTRKSEETILKAYDTMTGVEKLSIRSDLEKNVAEHL